jgi:hypothetical protein
MAGARLRASDRHRLDAAVDLAQNLISRDPNPSSRPGPAAYEVVNHHFDVDTGAPRLKSGDSTARLISRERTRRSARPSRRTPCGRSGHPGARAALAGGEPVSVTEARMSKAPRDEASCRGGPLRGEADRPSIRARSPSGSRTDQDSGGTGPVGSLAHERPRVGGFRSLRYIGRSEWFAA